MDDDTMKTRTRRQAPPGMRPPHFLGRYRGTPYARFHVRIAQDWLEDDLHHDHADVDVIARSAAEAANYVRDEIAPHVTRPTSILVLGPQGGVTERYIGWESMIAAQMCAERGAWRQLPLHVPAHENVAHDSHPAPLDAR